MKSKKLISVLLTIMMTFTLMFGVTSALAAAPDKSVSSIEGSNILLIGDYAFNLSDPANSNYNFNNFLIAAKTAYLNPVTGKYEVYFKIGAKWFDVVSDPTMAAQIPDVSKINGDGLFSFSNMVVVTPPVVTPPVTVDKTVLTGAISAANTNKATVTVSTYSGSDVLPANKWVTQANMDTYTAAITAAQAVVGKADATQTAVNDAVSMLATATAAFDSAKAAGTLVVVIPVPAPIITNVSVVSSNVYDVTKAVYGNTITLTFTSNEPVTKLSNFKINGSNPDTFTSVVGNVYTATHLVDSGDVVTGLPATFQINVKNAAGIYSQTIEKTTNGSSVTIAEPTPITGPSAAAFVKMLDFGYTANIDGAGTPGYNVGFQLQLAKLSYADITKIEASLVDTNGVTLVTRTAIGAQIAQLKADDLTYAPLDGQLSVAFIKRTAQDVNAWWTSTPYNFATPSKAVIKVTTTNHNTYIVENGALLGNPVPVTP